VVHSPQGLPHGRPSLPFSHRQKFRKELSTFSTSAFFTAIL
jgi:hypothetical protein